MTLNEALKILELNKNFTEEELKKSYHKLVLIYHPDNFPEKTKENLEATERIKEINEAHDVIKNYLDNNNINDINFIKLYITKCIKDLDNYKDKTNNPKLEKYNKKIDFIIQEFIDYSNSITNYLKLDIKYKECLQKILKIFQNVIDDFIEENNLNELIFYGINKNIKNLNTLYQKLMEGLKYIETLNNDLKKYEYKPGYQNLKSEIEDIKVPFLHDLVIKNYKTYQDMFNDFEKIVVTLFNKYNNSLLLTNYLINDIETFKKYINEDNVDEIYKSTLKILKTLKNDNQDHFTLDINIDKLETYKKRYRAIKELSLTLNYIDDIIKENNSNTNITKKNEFINFIQETIFKEKKTFTTAIFANEAKLANINVISDSYNILSSYYHSPIRIYINKDYRRNKNEISFLKIVEISYEYITLRYIGGKKAHKTITILKDEFIKNYILLGYLLYCDSKVLYDKNNQLLIFINDTYNYNITYSYETNTFQINNNSDFTIKNDVSSYPIMFNEIQKIISLAEYQLEKDETINKNSIGARIRRIFKRY